MYSSDYVSENQDSVQQKLDNFYTFADMRMSVWKEMTKKFFKNFFECILILIVLLIQN